MSSKGTIVIIDDSEIVLEQIRAELEPLGYPIKTTTQTVGTARLLVGADLVILDMHMPGLHGGQVLGNLRAAVESRATPPLFYMYTSDPAEEARYREYGFDGAFTQKGNLGSLARQLGAAMRMLKLKR